MGIPLFSYVPDQWRTPELRTACLQVDPLVWADSVLPIADVFRSLTFFKPYETRAIILGQDPYYATFREEGKAPIPKASGLAFGIRPSYAAAANYRFDSSIQSIIEEVKRSTGEEVKDLSLEGWAKQGLLLINTCLTVAEGRPGSHRYKGWEPVVANLLRQTHKGIMWLAWGRPAQQLATRLARPNDLILSASHPSSLSARRGPNPFIGCDHFARLKGVQWSR